MPNLRSALLASLSLAATTALAASPVGSWKGKIVAKMPALPPTVTPQQKAMIMKAMTQTHFTLAIKADKTFTLTISAAGAPTAGRTQKGTWTQKGNNITVKDTSSPQPPQTLVMSPDGKTLTLTAPNGQGKLVFTR